MGCAEDGRWRKIFVPTYIWFVAQQEDPWTVDDAVAKSAMQKIWQVVFGKDIPHKVTTDGPVFGVVSLPFHLRYLPDISVYRPNNESRMPGEVSLVRQGFQLSTHFSSQKKIFSLMKHGELSLKRDLSTSGFSTPTPARTTLL
jgi:hypothetical protein